MLISGHHFVRYARTVAAQLECMLNDARVENETIGFTDERVPVEIQN